MCRIITLVGVELIRTTLSLFVFEISATPRFCMRVWENPNFCQERSRQANKYTKVCRIITLVGVELIRRTLSLFVFEISATPCFCVRAWENFEIFMERIRGTNEYTRMCRIVTLVGVELIRTTLSHPVFEITATPCFF